MKTKNKFFLVLFLVGVVGFLVFGKYFKNQTLSENTTTTIKNIHHTTDDHLANVLKSAGNADEQLSSQLNNLSADIAELRKNSRSYRDTPNNTEEKIRKLNNEIEELHKQLKKLSNSITTRHNLPVSIPKQDDEMFNIEEREIELAKVAEQQLDFYDNTAIEEGVDQVWAAEAQTKVYESFQTLSADGVGVSEVKCYRSFCQAKVGINSNNNHVAIRKLQQSSLWKGESFILIKDIEQGEGVMYLAREGQALPTQ